MQRFNALPLALRALVSVAALGVLLVLITGIFGMASDTFERFSGFLGNEAPTRTITEEEPQERTREPTREENASISEDEYLDAVERLQAISVETFLDSDERFSRYDNLTADDIDRMKSDYEALEDYRNRAQDLIPPKKYEDQHEVFSSAIAELQQAAEQAHAMSAEPSSLTRTGLEGYELRADKAASGLRRSNEILGRDFKTIEDARADSS